MNLDDDLTAEDPPAELLRVLTLDEAHELLGILADVRDGAAPDQESAAVLLSNLAARVPSRPTQDADEPRPVTDSSRHRS